MGVGGDGGWGWVKKRGRRGKINLHDKFTYTTFFFFYILPRNERRRGKKNMRKFRADRLKNEERN